MSTPLLLSLVDLTKRGLEAHLQTVVLDRIIQEQLTAFAATLRASLEKHVKAITIGHVDHLTDVLNLRNEMRVSVEVDFKDAAPEDSL